MNDDDAFRRIDEELSRPLSDDEIDKIEVDVEFESMTDPGHWCPACGQEQPAGPACGECYDQKSMLAQCTEDDVAERRAFAMLMSPRDLADLSWLWRS